MSEVKEKYTLEEFVFRDIRIIDKPRANSYKDVVKNALEQGNDPVAKVLEYQRIMKKVYDQAKPDAERWKIALESYMYYPCFRSDKSKEESIKTEYQIESGCIICKEDNFSVRITADTLTGPSEIIDPARELGLLDHEAIKEFCSVAYTIGNVCPVMKNPGGGSDTCWGKLGKYHDTSKHIIFDGTKKYKGWDNDINNRTPDNMFAVFPENLSGRKIVDKLMLNDYYDEDYNLILTHEPQYYAVPGKEEIFINFVRLVTSLIIKRGIRIYNALPPEMKA